MTSNHTETLINSLDALLEKERQALLKGDLDAISTILHEKEAILDQFGAIDEPRTETLAPLREKVSRNQALLESALKGIREVAERMNALRRTQRSLETYDSAGRKSVVVTRPENRVEKRA